MFRYNFEHYRALAICRYNLDVINKSLLCHELVRKKHVDIKLAAMFVNAVDRTSCPRENIGGSGATVALAPPPPAPRSQNVFILQTRSVTGGDFSCNLQL